MTSPLPELINHVVTGSPVEDVYDLQLDGTKIGWYRDRVEAWRRGEKIAPITMDVAWTRKCSAGCNFCYAALQASGDGGVITKDIAFNFLEDAADIGVKGISLISDGESTEVPYFADSVEYGRSLGIQIGTSSNGVKLTPDILERILPWLSYLRFNFSGGDKKRWAQIMGLKQPLFDRVISHIKAAMEIKRRKKLDCNINMQFVVMPTDADQIIPFVKLAKEIRPDYAILKHTADSADNALGVDYRKYSDLFPLFEEAESYSDDDFRVAVKWSRIQDEGKRDYQRCFGPPFILQMSGNGLIAPCGQKFQERYKKFHIGWVAGPNAQRFKDIYQSDRYWDVLRYLASDAFNAQTECGPNCLQTNTNSWLDKWMQGSVDFPTTSAPPQMGFL
jgi:MoaA/NifB/PqqE/SkfB family radical SAM enzyme